VLQTFAGNEDKDGVLPACPHQMKRSVSLVQIAPDLR
jgi:hypothetical protein